jgi:glycerol-3-phosphate acyltransferase PlsX
MARNDLNAKIAQDLKIYHAKRQPSAGPEAA